MKKIFTLCALAAMTLPVTATAQDQAKYRLTDMEDVQFGETFVYEWDEETGNLLGYEASTDLKVRFAYEYDSKNQCIKETIYQDLDRIGKEFPTSYIDYTYDEQGRMATRTNYNNETNSVDAKWEIQATDYFTYDEKGLLVLREMYRGTEKVQRVQTRSFFYDDQNRLIREDNVTFRSNGAQLSSGQVQYFYNENGTLAEKCTLDPNEAGTLMPTAYTVYIYGEDGVIDEVYTTGSQKIYENKNGSYLYTVDKSIPAADVIYPIVPEPYYDTEIYTLQPYMILTEKEYVRADNGEIVLDHDWVYNYESFNVGIANMGVAGHSLVSATVIGDELRLLGVSRATNVFIFDMNGRVVKRLSDVGNSINVADLPKGVYVVSSLEGSAKFVR